MSTVRTKLLFFLSALPLVFLAGCVVWAKIYVSHLLRTRQGSFFVVFHFHWFLLLMTSAVFFLCGLISLFLDRRSMEKKRPNG